MQTGLEVANLQWAEVNYKHLQRQFVRTGHYADLVRAMLAWCELERAKAVVGSLWGNDATG